MAFLSVTAVFYTSCGREILSQNLTIPDTLKDLGIQPMYNGEIAESYFWRIFQSAQDENGHFRLFTHENGPFGSHGTCAWPEYVTAIYEIRDIAMVSP